MRKNLITIKTCKKLMDTDSLKLSEKCILSRCKDGPLITDNMAGELMCGSCGVVLSEKMEDYVQEYRTFTKEDYMQQTRTGMKSTLTIHDMGLATKIGSKNKDVSGKRLSSKMNFAFNRLRVWDARSKMYSRERSMQNAFTLLDGMAAKLGLPEFVSEKAAYFYRKIKSKNPRTGKFTESLIAAALYAACRSTNTPRTLNDIAQAANVKKKRLQKSYRDIVKRLGLNIEQYDPIEFVSRISSEVSASEKTRRYAVKILIKARKTRILTGKHPMGMAAAALYFSGIHNNEDISQEKISGVSGVTTVTIRHGYQTLVKGIGISPLESLTK